jgi:nucleoside-diphosphate-sugar epimerase
MKTVALLGYKGFVGRAIYQQLQKAGYKVTGVSIDTHAKLRSGNYDIVINSAMPSKKYWALQHPVEDFTASAQFTARCFLLGDGRNLCRSVLFLLVVN